MLSSSGFVPGRLCQPLLYSVTGKKIARSVRSGDCAATVRLYNAKSKERLLAIFIGNGHFDWRMNAVRQKNKKTTDL
jgi:hypothetical protein